MNEVVRREVLKFLDAGIIYPISDSKWVSPTQVIPKKLGVTVVMNEHNELVPTRIQTGWRMSIDYRKLNATTKKDYFSFFVFRPSPRMSYGPSILLFSRWLFWL